MIAKPAKILARLFPHKFAAKQQPQEEDKRSYLDQLTGARLEARRWRSLALWSICSSGPMGLTIAFLLMQVIANVDRTKFILSPAVHSFDIVSPEEVSDSYIKAAWEHVAHRNSSWTYETLEENYSDLFDRYYVADLATRTKASLAAAGRVDYVKKNRMISTFKIDQTRSEYTWCKALTMACGIVTGREETFIDGNQPFKSGDVSYLIFGRSIIPTKNNPFSMRITRLVVGDYAVMKKALEAAKEGRLPDAIDQFTQER